MKTLILISVMPVAFFLSHCTGNPEPQGHSHGTTGGAEEHAGDHEHDQGSLSFTEFSGQYELFVEFPPLVVDHTSEFAAHITRLDDYRPAEQGELTVSLIKGNKGIRHTVEKPSTPGIFRPALQPEETGTYQLRFVFRNNSDTAVFQPGTVDVYGDHEEVPAMTGTTADQEIITFLKEQAWKTEFQTEAVHLKPYHKVISTSARVMNQPGSEVTQSATVPGNIFLTVVRGETVQKGDILAFIVGAGLDNNLSVRLEEYRIAFERSRADYDRTGPLAKKGAASEKQFLEIRARYLQDSVQYFHLARNLSSYGWNVKAPFSGYISDILTKNGMYVDPGTPLFKVSNNNRLVIEAYVNQSDHKAIGRIFDAHFRLPSDDKVFTLSEVDGKISSENAFINNNATRIPVTLTVANDGRLIPGMYLEVFLLTNKKENAKVVPRSALIEEEGQYFVYLQKGGESFVRKQVQIRNDDGIQVEIESGLQPGDRLVTRGAYQIKLASMAGGLPLHGHTH